MFHDLMEPEYGVDQSPPDDTRIVQVIMYFSEQEAREMKLLAKEAMKVEMPETYIQKGNLSDLFLLLLKRHYGNTNS